MEATGCDWETAAHEYMVLCGRFDSEEDEQYDD